MSSLFSDYQKPTLFQPKPLDWVVRGNPSYPQVPAPQPFSLVPQNNPYRSVINSQLRLALSGQPVPQPDRPGVGQLLFKALDLIDRPRNAIFSGIKGATDNDPSTTVLGQAWKGLKGEVTTRGSDFIPETAPKLVRAVGGFALDVVGDPLTYLTAGTAKLGETALLGAKAGSASQKFRELLNLGEKAVVTPEMVKTLGTKAEDALTTAKGVATQASRAATQSRKWYFPGLSSVEQAKVDELQTFLKTGLKDAATNPVVDRDLFEKLGVKGVLNREGVLVEQFGVSSPRTAAFLDATKNMTDGDFLKALVEQKRRKTTLDATYAALGSYLPPEIAKLTPEKKAIALQLFDIFGLDSGLNFALAADRAGTNLSAKGLSKGLEKLGSNLTRLDTARSAVEKATTEVQLTRELSAAFEKETGRYFLKFMGQPIIDLKPAKDFVFDKAVMPLYSKVPLVKGIVDTWGELFLPHYIKWSEAVKAGVGTSLKTFEQKLTQTLRMENAIPHLVVNSAVTTLGKEFIENPKLNKNLGYYIEAHMAAAMMPDLEKVAEHLGTSGAIADLEAAKEAVAYWEKLAPDFAPDELAALERGRLAYAESAKDLFQVDEMIGREYDPILEGYYHHVYEQDDKVVKEHLRSVLDQRERLRKKVSTGLDGADKERRFLSLAYAKKIGLKPMDDAVTSLAVRTLRTQRARSHWELAQKLLDLPEIVSERQLSGYVKLGDMIPALNGKYVHAEVERHLKRLDYIFFTDPGTEEMFRHIRGITNLVKAAQVGYNPNFVVRNFLGEGLMNLFAGVGVEAHGLAYKVLGGANDAVQVADEVMPMQQLVKEFQEDGLWYAGVTKGNLAKSLQELTVEEGRVATGGARQQINVLGKTTVGGMHVTLNPNVLRETSDWFDRWYRLSHYIDRRLKGFGREGAAQDVRKFHVDYQDLTSSEKAIWRTIVPYYTYFRKNLPIQLRLFVEQPGYQTAIAKLVNNASHALGDPELSKYATESLALPLYQKDDGDVVVLNWNLPIVDVGRVHTGLRENLQDQLGGLTPLVRVPFEVATNRTLSVDRPIEKYQGEQVPMFEHLKGSPKVSAKLKYALEQFGGSLVNVPASSVGRFTDYEQEIPDRPMQIPVFQSLLPVQRPSTAQQASQYRYRDKLLAAIQAAQGNGKSIIDLTTLGPAAR